MVSYITVSCGRSPVHANTTVYYSIGMMKICILFVFGQTVNRAISQLPKLCVKISILRHRRMWVRSFSTRLTSVTFAEDEVLIFLILRKNAKIVQL